MKKPSECSETEMELFKETSPGEVNKALEAHVAEKIARDLRGFPKDKLIEVAVSALRYSQICDMGGFFLNGRGLSGQNIIFLKINVLIAALNSVIFPIWRPRLAGWGTSQRLFPFLLGNYCSYEKAFRMLRKGKGGFKRNIV